MATATLDQGIGLWRSMRCPSLQVLVEHTKASTASCHVSRVMNAASKLASSPQQRLVPLAVPHPV